MLRRWPVLLRPIVWIIALLACPVQSVRQATRLHRASPELMDRFGNSAFRRIATLAWLSMRYNLPAEKVVEWYSHPDRSRMDLWWEDLEGVRLLEALNDSRAMELAIDKQAFALWCERNGFQAVPTLASWSGGDSQSADPVALPGEVVLKPARGSQGGGVSLWQRDGDNWRSGARAITAADWSAMLVRASPAGHVILAQPRLHPHADLAALTAPAATVLRVNSALLKTGGTEIVSAYLSLHPAGSFVASPAERTERGIDFASGETLPSQSVLAPRWTGSESPDGRPIPHWSELCSLVRKAHAAFPGSPVLLGWDVAVTDDGPVLIEVNTRVGFGLHQRATGQPACAGRWGIILDEWLKAKF